MPTLIFSRTFKPALLFFLIFSILMAGCTDSKTPRILIFSKTMGYHHESIPYGIRAIEEIAQKNHIAVDTTTDAGYFTDDKLKRYRAIVFLSTTGNILNSDQQVGLQRYMEAGGGFVGIHAAADAEYNWPYYDKLVGAWFLSHPGNPNVRKATVVITDSAGPGMHGLPQQWERTDEWYNYKNINPAIHVLAKLDEDSYEGGANGENHPIAWYHEFDGGRVFYTGGGHTTESYSEPLFLQHIEGGIKYAMGDTMALDYSKAYAVKAPEDNRFTKQVLSNNLNEPMELGVAPGGLVYFVERSGNFFLYDPTLNTTKLVYRFPVLQDTKQAAGNGVLGITLDPNFTTNNWIYFYHTPDKQPAEQYLSRFTLVRKDSLDLSTEKVILKVPIDMEVSAHTGGSLAWDKAGNLYISTGDNTVPFESDGYAPIDQRQGRLTFDAERSAGNSNDLRGKILRIHPEANGTYTIPEGNLFPKDEPKTRPEIYVMGCRNPYRISVDPVTSILYWGEVGPDAGNDGKQGPRGYDEFNQAKKAGYYGWPYFVGNNKPYHQYNFETKEVGPLFDTNAPVNNSPYNTGLNKLPPATPAMVWYPYALSDEFPALGTGGRCAMAGPVYHYNANGSGNGLPEYYDKALFGFDWMRNWVYVMRFDKDQHYKRMEEFMPSNGDFRRPIDMAFDDNGIIYMLEYGSVYGADNDDARLVRITYNGGNRAPLAKIRTNDTIGLAPMKVGFRNDSRDPDEDDQLTYLWKFDDGGENSGERSPEHVFKTNGVHHVVLSVADPSGLKSRDTLNIVVGNTLPDVTINTSSNKSFYFPGVPLQYAVNIQDKEDKEINSNNIKVSLRFVPKDALIQTQRDRQGGMPKVNAARALIDASDCKACHQMDQKSVGPSFMDISKRYHNKDVVDKLAAKIISGGAGVWGDHAMSAHPQFSINDTKKIVEYILALSDQQTINGLPKEGKIDLKKHLATKKEGVYFLDASYTDKGAGVEPLTGTQELMLRSPEMQAEDADMVRNLRRGDDQVGRIRNKSWFAFRNIDLTGIKSLAFRYSSKENGATIEVHEESAKGPVIATASYAPTGDWRKFREINVPVRETNGAKDLYFVFVKEEEPNNNLGSIDWVEFKK